MNHRECFTPIEEKHLTRTLDLIGIDKSHPEDHTMISETTGRFGFFASVSTCEPHLKEEDLFEKDIRNNVTKKMKERAKNIPTLKNSLELSIKKMKEFLNSKDIKYELEADVWQPVEFEDSGGENSITIHIECDDFDKRREIEDEIRDIVRESEKDDLIIYTMIKRF